MVNLSKFRAHSYIFEYKMRSSLKTCVFSSVRPYRTEVIGADRPVEDGAMVSLMCRTWGARPAAVITWFNGSRPFSEQPAGQVALQASVLRHLIVRLRDLLPRQI